MAKNYRAVRPPQVAQAAFNFLENLMQAARGEGKFMYQKKQYPLYGIIEKAKKLGSFLEKTVDTKGHQLVVGIHLSNSIECAISIFACTIFGMKEIPITEENKQNVIRSTNMNVLICETQESVQKIQRLFESSTQPKCPEQYVIIKEYPSNKYKPNYSSFGEIVYKNESATLPPWDKFGNYILDWYDEDGTSRRSYSFDDFDTLIEDVHGKLLEKEFGKNDVFLSCSMMTNPLDRIMQAIVLGCGGSIYLGSNETEEILKTLKEIKPSVFAPSDKFLQESFRREGDRERNQEVGYFKDFRKGVSRKWTASPYKWKPKLFVTSSLTLSEGIRKDFVRKKFLTVLQTVFLRKTALSGQTPDSAGPEGTPNQTEEEDFSPKERHGDDQISARKANDPLDSVYKKDTKPAEVGCLQPTRVPPPEKEETHLNCVSYVLVKNTSTRMVAEAVSRRVKELDSEAAEKSEKSAKTHLIVTCLNATRLTTDVEFATEMSEVKAGANAILVVFRHLYKPSTKFESSSSILDKETKAPYSLILDIICRNSKEIYDTEHNEQTAQALFNYLSK